MIRTSIQLSNGDTTWVDDADLRSLAGFSFYPRRTKTKTYVEIYRRAEDGRRERHLLHRFLTKAPTGLDVDHIDGNPLNNCRDNLRVVSRTINNLNRPGSRGCYFEARTGRWRADLWVNKRRIRLGRFPSFALAHAAYADERRKHLEAA